MDVLPWFWIWIVLTAVLCVGEMLTATFFLLPFAVGTAAAAIAEFFGAPLWLQFALLIVLSVIALVAMRPLARRITRDNPEKAGAERLIGSIGIVIAHPNNSKRELRVLVQADEWNAVSTDGAILPVNSKVQVLRVEGAHLVVRAAADQTVYSPPSESKGE